MTDPANAEPQQQAPDPRAAATNAAAPSPGAEPSLAEDLLLVLYRPESGTISGEGTLYYVLAGAVLADLALQGAVTTEADPRGKVSAVAGARPSDATLQPAWDYVAEKPRGVQTVLAAIGPELREPLLEKLIQHGHVQRIRRRALGLFESTALRPGEGDRRRDLVMGIRAVLADGAEPTGRIAALAALLWASGTLPEFHREIPWNSTVIERAQALERGNWGADAAANAVARTVASTIVNSVVVAAALLPRG